MEPRPDLVAVRDLEEAPTPYLLYLAGNAVAKLWRRAVDSQHGISSAGAQVLLMLSRGKATHREVARRCWVHPATLTGVVDTLERDGLVERRRSGTDRRRVYLLLTPAGERLAQQVRQALWTAFGPLRGQEPAQERVVREYLIRTIKAYLDEELCDDQASGSRPGRGERRGGERRGGGAGAGQALPEAAHQRG